MLPRQLALLDSQLSVAPRFKRLYSTPLSVAVTVSAAPPLRLGEKDYDRLFVNGREVLEDLLQESRDIAPDSRLKLLSELGKQISRIDLLLAEVGPNDEFRRLVLVEDKLLKNNQSRREVLA